jgi:hypothetical protein
MAQTPSPAAPHDWCAERERYERIMLVELALLIDRIDCRLKALEAVSPTVAA